MNEITIYLTSNIGAGFVGHKKCPIGFTLGELVARETGLTEDRAFDTNHIRVNREEKSKADAGLVLVDGNRISITPNKIDGGSC